MAGSVKASVLIKTGAAVGGIGDTVSDDIENLFTLSLN